MESTRRQSKKRDAIREILLASYDHPSVEEIYRRLTPDIPDLSRSARCTAISRSSARRARR